MEGNEGGIFSKAPEKKSALINDCKILHIGKKPRIARHRQVSFVCSKYSWGVCGNHNHGKTLKCLLYFKLFPAFIMTQYYYINMNIIFS